MKAFPVIKVDGKLEFESFSQSNFKTVKYGDYEFIEDTDGFVQIYTTAYVDEGPYGFGTFAVCYGYEHPL